MGDETLISLHPDRYREYPILYVDDDPTSLELFARSFDGVFAVQRAASAAEALALLDLGNIAIVVTDLRMPGTSGVELCEIVSERHPTVLRAVLTAHGDKQTAVDAINRGRVHRFVDKPWNWADIQPILSDLVVRAHLDQTVRTLRRAMLEREREVALAHTRALILHDLSNMTVPLSAGIDVLRERAVELAGSCEAEAWRGLMDEIEVLDEAIGHLVETHQKGRRVAPLGRSATPDTGVGEVARLVCEVLGREQRAARVESRCPRELRVHTDRVSLARILMNLVRNACNAIHDAGQRDGLVVVRAAPAGPGRVDIFVDDNGPGIPAAVRDRIFDLRFSGRASAGQGLGLYIARLLAESEGGTLELVPSPGPGASFRLRLPSAVAVQLRPLTTG